MTTYIMIAILSLTIGLLIGRQQGLKMGYRQGFAAAPLILRQKSYAEGYCILCNSGKNSNLLHTE